MFKKLVLCSCLTLLWACGGSNDVSGPSEPEGGAKYPELIIGTISELTRDTFNVNGYKLNINEAGVNYAGERLAADVLKEGLSVRVLTNGTEIQQVQLDPNYAGVVTSVSTSEFVLNGITLTLPNASALVSRGDYVLINSSPDKRVNAWTSLGYPLRWLEIEGVVSQLDPANKRFVLANMVVDYRNAIVEDGPLNNGVWVEVYGELNNSQFTASNIDVESYSGSGKIEMEGIISWVSDEKNAFELNNRLTFGVTKATRFEDGRREDLAVGRVVEVTFVTAQQSTELLEVEFEDGYGQVHPGVSFSLSGQAQFLNNELNVQGFGFVIDAQTRFDDGLSLYNLHGAMVDVEGVMRDSQFLVREIELMDMDNEIDLEGWVDNNSIWGYQPADDSLRVYEGLWIDLSCRFDGLLISACRPD